MKLIRSAYDWALRQSEKARARWILFAVAFAESSVFPLPPDALLLPMCIARRDQALRLAAICTLGSVLGGLLGYAIGALLFETVGQWVVDTYRMQEAFDRFHQGFNEWGVWIILAKGLTPIPYKLVTIASGVAHFPLLPFVLASIVTRGLRFFIVAALVMKFGAPIQVFIEKYLTWVALGFLVLIMFGFWLVLH
ncbi:MAG: VTT domain-containing protein [Alphaproteobacteria bacterium]